MSGCESHPPTQCCLAEFCKRPSKNKDFSKNSAKHLPKKHTQNVTNQTETEITWDYDIFVRYPKRFKSTVLDFLGSNAWHLLQNCQKSIRQVFIPFELRHLGNHPRRENMATINLNKQSKHVAINQTWPKKSKNNPEMHLWSFRSTTWLKTANQMSSHMDKGRNIWKALATRTFLHSALLHPHKVWKHFAKAQNPFLRDYLKRLHSNKQLTASNLFLRHLTTPLSY